MAALVYKYVGASYLERVFELRNYVTLKCSLPKNFNDPYELFLTVSFREKPEALAFYTDIIEDLPQLPVTCFSRSPSILPMWAHYAENLTGVVLAFDEEKLGTSFSNTGFGDIDYRDKPDPGLTDLLYHAFHIGKMRYLYLLRQGVFSSAYYSKASCWRYEQERRMLLSEQHMRVRGPALLVDVPRNCLSAIICGPRASSETFSLAQEKGGIAQCPVYQLRIGRSSTEPYFVDNAGTAYVFKHQSLIKATAMCKSCGEALSRVRRTCSWCRIRHHHKVEAASRNSLRMLAQYGLLEEYISGMDNIARSHRRK